MLPFRLRPPSYGGKLKKAKQEQASPLDQNHPLRDGGPLQRAINDDLIAQYPKFIAALHESVVDDAHQSKGDSFKIFKKIFSNAGIALLHTQLTPQRCDAAAYSQLIYAVCFDLLRRVFKPDEDTVSFGAFVVFLLYSLYETNPYPTKLSSELESLPVNLQDSHNPRLTFRRCYRERIRIDSEHFHYILQLQDICLEKVARAQAEMGNVEDASNVTCSLARDTAEVISRLMPNFDFCAYTGPCGLDALAGHGDYPVPPTAATQKWWKENRQQAPLTDATPEAPLVPIGETYKIPIRLEEQVEHYINLRKNIKQSQASRNRHKRRSGRTGDAATHLFSRKKTALEKLAFFTRTPPPEKKRVKLRHGVVEIPIDASTHPSRNTRTEVSDTLSAHLSAVNNNQEENAPELHVVLPGGLTSALEESLQDAFETLVQRKVMLPPASVTAHQEEVSTLARSQSVATSVTGTGRNALRALLQKATSGFSEGQSTAFLESQEDATDGRESALTNDVVSDISSDEGNVTIAGSTVGRSALRDLLSYATDTAARGKAKRNKAPKRAPRKKPPPPPPKTKKGDNAQRVSLEGTAARSEGTSVQHEYSQSSHDDSTSSTHDSNSGNVGRAALNALLARASV